MKPSLPEVHFRRLPGGLLLAKAMQRFRSGRASQGGRHG
jgi:hypothetical protein